MMTVRKSYFYSKIFALVEDIAIFLSVAAEGPSLPTAPAICNAIFDAVGVRLFDLPALPERVKAES
jgi:hypothetical protein